MKPKVSIFTKVGRRKEEMWFENLYLLHNTVFVPSCESGPFWELDPDTYSCGSWIRIPIREGAVSGCLFVWELDPDTYSCRSWIRISFDSDLTLA